MLPHDVPRWEAVSQQTQRWVRAGGFEAIAHVLLRLAAGRTGQPSAVILDARTGPATPESDAGAGDDGHQRRTGRTVHLAVDTLGHLLATVITPANEQARAQVAERAERVQQVTGHAVELADVDQGSTGDAPARGTGTQARGRLAAAPLGRRAQRRVAGPLSTAGPRR